MIDEFEIINGLKFFEGVLVALYLFYFITHIIWDKVTYMYYRNQRLQITWDNECPQLIHLGNFDVCQERKQGWPNSLAQQFCLNDVWDH